MTGEAGETNAGATGTATFGNAVEWTNGCAQASTANPTTLFSASPFTVEFWLQIASGDPTWQVLLWRGGNSSSGPAGWNLELSSAGDGSYRLQLCGKDGPDNWACVASTDALTVGARYHLAVVRMPPGSGCVAEGMGGCARFYMATPDGPGVFAHTEVTAAFDPDWATAEPLRLGAAGATCNEFPTLAIMDELRIWSTARSRSEIDDAAREAPSCAEPGLVSYYRFDETDGTELGDCSTLGDNLFGVGELARVSSPFSD